MIDLVNVTMFGRHDWLTVYLRNKWILNVHDDTGVE